MAERDRRASKLRLLTLGTAIILLASLFQFHQLGRDLRFHPDEAFFMTFARSAAVNGDWLLPGALDKPPLSIYLSAFGMIAFGNTADAAGVLQLDPHVGEFAGKLPNVLLSLLLTALMMRLARHIYRDETTALLAGLLTATSPFILAYGASAFTDMSLLLFSVAAFYLALKRRWAFAGVALGLAFWGKQQALFVALMLALLLLVEGARRRDWIRFLLPLSGICLALLIWDSARPETSILLQAAANNAPAQLWAAPTTWLERLAEWLNMATWLLGPPLIIAILLAVAAFAIFRRAGSAESIPASDRFLIAAIIAYSFIHIIFSFNLYDRYLLLILPLMTLLAARWIAALCRCYSRLYFQFVIVAMLLLSAFWSLNNDSPIGGDHRAHAGIDKLADHLNSKPVATVIYDPWLGWQLGYYLGQWHDKRRVHHPTAEALIADALALDESGDRYLVAPVDQPYDAWLSALRDAGFEVSEEYRRDQFVAFRLTPGLSPKD